MNKKRSSQTTIKELCINNNVKRLKTSQQNDSNISNDENDSVQQVRAGSLKKILLINFMCHSHFEINFNRNINFLVGRNGSGKSAIITALVVGLGAKASVTNRGSSTKTFIKANETSASIEIILCNEGYMAYKPNEFGREIKIIRHFGKNSNTYKIKAANGTTMGTTVRELKRIMEYFQIDVDNPVVILNQDMSRNFLNSTDPKMKFKLFMNGTKLDLLFERYQEILNNKKIAVTTLTRKGAEIEDLNREVERIKQKMVRAQEMRKMKNKVADLQIEVAWAKINKAEKELQALNDTEDRFKKECTKIKEHIKSKSTRIQAIKESIDSLQKQLLDLRQEISTKENPQKHLKDSLNALKDKLLEKNSKKLLIQDLIAKKTRDANNLEREIRENEKKREEINAFRETKMKNIQQAEEKIRVLQRTIEATTHDLRCMTAAVNKKKDEGHGISNELREADNKLSQLMGQIKSLKAHSSNALCIYGQEMPRVLDEINKSKRMFQKMPLGPVGNYIKLKDKRWNLAAEAILSVSLLKSFLVDNSADYTVLNNIFSKVYGNQRKPQIVISKFFDKMHNISRTKTASVNGTTPFLDVLEIENPVIANAIIDQRGVECFLLVDNAEVAERIMSDINLVPKNCNRCITVEGHEYYPEPNYKFYKSMIRRASLLQSSTVDLVKSLEEEIQSIQRKKSVMQEVINKNTPELKKLLEEQSNLQEKLNKCNRSLVLERRIKEDLQDSVEPNLALIETLNDDFEKAQRTITRKRAEDEELDHAIAELNIQIKELDSKLSEIKQSVLGMFERVEELMNQVETEKSKQNQINVDEKFEKERLHLVQRRLQETEQEALNKQQELRNLMEISSVCGPRIETERSVAEIASEIEELNRQLTNVEGTSINELVRQFNELQRKYMTAKNSYDLLIEKVEILAAEERHRNKLYKHIRQDKVTAINEMFNFVMEQRKFKGEIEVDFIKNTLLLTVLPKEKISKNNSTQNLSGGERSYSTIAFLHSIWQCMDTPFYFLDEFDVFMDKLNRSLCMDLLIAHATKRPESQFVFLTPQDISTVKVSDTCTIHKLSDPERTNK